MYACAHSMLHESFNCDILIINCLNWVMKRALDSSTPATMKCVVLIKPSCIKEISTAGRSILGADLIYTNNMYKHANGNQYARKMSSPEKEHASVAS